MSNTKNDNLKLWNAVEETDPTKTKRANVGGLSLTAINATSQIKRATEHWGMYGSTWGLKNINYEYMDIDKTRLAIVRAMFYYPKGEFEISTSIKVYYMTQGAKGYLKIDDDFLKKAETDLTTKSLSKLGFNADIFMGLYDDNKYLAALKEKYAEEKKEKQTPPPPPPPKKTELKKLSEAVFKKMKVSDNLDSLTKSLTKYKLDEVQKTAINKRILELKTPPKKDVKLKKLSKTLFEKMRVSDNLDSLTKSLMEYELDEKQKSIIKQRILKLKTPPTPQENKSIPTPNESKLKKLSEAIFKKMKVSDNLDSLTKSLTKYELKPAQKTAINKRILELKNKIIAPTKLNVKLKTPTVPVKLLGELKILTEPIKIKMLKSKNINSLRKAKDVYILDVSTENQIKIRIEQLIKEKNG